MDVQMTFKYTNIKNIILALIVLMVVVFISHHLLNIRTQALIEEKYTNIANEMQFTTQSYIDAKMKSILFIALSLAHDQRYVDAITSSKEVNFELDKFAQNLKHNTEYQNVWIQVSDNKGISLYRSWTDTHGDDLTKVRKDIVQMIQNPQIQSTISTGIFDMTFKAMVPIFSNDTFMGTIEVISKFNSVARQLLNKKYELVLLVDKSYNDQITQPFTKMFLKCFKVK